MNSGCEIIKIGLEYKNFKFSKGSICREDLNMQALEMAMVELNCKKEILRHREELMREQG